MDDPSSFALPTIHIVSIRHMSLEHGRVDSIGHESGFQYQPIDSPPPLQVGKEKVTLCVEVHYYKILNFGGLGFMKLFGSGIGIDLFSLNFHWHRSDYDNLHTCM